MKTFTSYFLSISFTFIFIVGCASKQNIFKRTPASQSPDAKEIVSERLTLLSKALVAEDLVMQCEEASNNALSQKQNWARFQYSPGDQNIFLELSGNPNPITISLKNAEAPTTSSWLEGQKRKNKTLISLLEHHNGFTISNPNCKSSGEKFNIFLNYIETDGSGLLGSRNPFANLDMSIISEKPSATSSCSNQEKSSCSCTNYAGSSTRKIRCSVYYNPFKNVSTGFRSVALEKAYQELYALTAKKKESLSKEKPLFQSGAEVAIEKIRSSQIFKYQLDSSYHPENVHDAFMVSLPELTEETVLSIAQVSAQYVRKVSESAVYAGLLFNEDFDSHFVPHLIKALKINTNWSFYRFDMNSLTSARVDGWLIYDKNTREVLVVSHKINFTLWNEYLKNRSKNTSAKETKPLDPCETGNESSLIWENKPSRNSGGAGACFWKNNPYFPTIDLSLQATWQKAFQEFLAGNEISLNTSFKSPGVCYDRDGIPLSSDLGLTKRSPVYIVKNKEKVALYSHQILKMTNHDIWAPGDEACQAKEEIFRNGAIYASEEAKKRNISFEVEKNYFDSYPEQCFSHYKGAFKSNVIGSFDFFLRKTPIGIMMLWPRPNLNLDSLESVPLLCIFPSQAVE